MRQIEAFQQLDIFLAETLALEVRVGKQEVREPFLRDARQVQSEEFKWLFPDCPVEAIPPFGNLYGLPTFVDNAFEQKRLYHFCCRHG
jgi:hypothetical protein